LFDYPYEVQVGWVEFDIYHQIMELINMCMVQHSYC